MKGSQQSGNYHKNKSVQQLKMVLHDVGVFHIPRSLCNKGSLLKMYNDLKPNGKCYVNIEPLHIPSIDDDIEDDDDDDVDNDIEDDNNNNSISSNSH